MSRSVSKLAPASAPAPSGSAIGGLDDALETGAVALEHPEVGEQMVAEVDRLGALQVRVAGHRPVAVSGGRSWQRAHQALELRSTASCARRLVKSETSVATWSLRERAVCSFAPASPTSSVRRRSIAMWMSSSSSLNDEDAGVELLLDQRHAVLDLFEITGADDVLGGEHLGVGDRTLDVLRVEALVEIERRVDRLEKRVLWVFEAGHGGKLRGGGSRRPAYASARASAPTARSTSASVI